MLPYFMVLALATFETPVTVTPQQAISKTLNLQKFPKNTSHLLLGNERLLLGKERLLLGKEPLLLGRRRLLLGRQRLLLGIIGVWGVFGNFSLCCRGSERPEGGFRTYLKLQGSSGTEPEPETGTVGTVFPKPKVEPEPPEPFSRNRNRNRNRPSLLNCAETQKSPFCRGTARTENRNRSNPSTPKP